VSFSFRVPIWLPDDQRIDWPHRTLDLFAVNGRKVYLKADIADELSSAPRLALRGDGYATEAEAQHDGELWLDLVSIALVDMMIGHDLRPAGPRSFFSEFALNAARDADPGHQHFGEHTGVFVFASNPPALFNEISATGVASKRGVDLQSRAVAAHAKGIRLDERLKLARDLYGAAMFLTSDEARFIALVTAVESLIEQPMRPEVEIRLLELFVAQVQAAEDLDGEDRERLANGLRALKRQSIISSGKLLAAAVGDKEYLGRKAPEFWGYSFRLRSSMSHGTLGSAEVHKLREASPAMQLYFHDLFLALVS
jgi:hypothetical protein